MRISDILLPNSVMRRGFTLLELLIVIAVMSLMAGLALPRTMAMYESFRRSVERDNIIILLAGLGRLAYSHGISFRLETVPFPDDSPLKHLLDMPPGWTVTAKQPVLYRYNGICAGGRIILQDEEETFSIQLDPPFCRPYILK